MLRDLLLPISVTMGILTFGLAARWYVVPRVRRLPTARALAPFLLLHAFRYVGLAFLITGVTAAPLDPRFAEPAAWGDLLAAILALASAVSLRAGVRGAVGVAWVFNLVGTVDLLNALWQGLRHTPDGHLGATYFIPAVLVPALLVTHALMFWMLLTGEGRGRGDAVAV